MSEVRQAYVIPGVTSAEAIIEGARRRIARSDDGLRYLVHFHRSVDSECNAQCLEVTDMGTAPLERPDGP